MHIFFILVFVVGLFGFKISVFDLYQVGFRIDDILLAISIIVIIFGLQFKLNIPYAVRLYLLFILLSVVSTILGWYRGNIGILESSLYSFRAAEYLIFFFIGQLASNKLRNLDWILKAYAIYVSILIILQFYGLAPVFSKFLPNRAIGNTGGPWELGGVAGFLFIYFFHYSQLPYALISSVVMYLTFSRVSIAALLIIYSKHILWLRRKQILVLLSGLLFVAFVRLEMFSEFSHSLTNRFFIAYESLDRNILMNLYETAPILTNRTDYLQVAFSTESLKRINELEADLSLNIRIYRWFMLLKIFSSTWHNYLFGVGPGFAGVAVDGYYVRILVENGIFGLAIFLLFVVSFLLRVRDKIARNYFIFLLLSGFVIDIFNTYKVMMLFWFYYGYICRKNRTVLSSSVQAFFDK